VANTREQIKKAWNWLWHSDSWLSYIVFLILIFIFIKLIFFPGLSLILGTELPMAIVESSSMSHNIVSNDQGGYDLCGKYYEKQELTNKEEYWDICGKWYVDNTNLTQENMNSFSFPNGFSKGDLMIIVGKENIKIGDVIVFNGGSNHPIIHRVISLNPIQTKGDHNNGQLAVEINIKQEQIIGTAVAKIPFVGWVKLFFVELFNR